MSENIPSKDPAADSSMGSMLREVFSKALKSVDGMLPATVVSYNRETNRATVVPSIHMVTTGGQNLERAPYANIPVLALGGGEFVINFPLKAGDTGWIEASDRDISLWLQSKGANRTAPNTHRIHSFSDGRFIPDMLANYTLSEDAGTDGMVIQHKDGASAVVVFADRVLIKSTTIDFEGTAAINMKAPEIKIEGPTTVTGGLGIDGIDFGTHVHGGVQTGSNTTNGPQG